jgi:hypothetical protein
MPSDSLQILDFPKNSIFEKLGDSDVAKYLFDYLKTVVKARSVVYEGRYVDRHYLDDFAQYYSRSFNAPASYCQRFHFFKIDSNCLDQHLSNACEGTQELEKVEKELCEQYLGFVVIRPLVGAEIGRAVLRTYPPDGLSRYTVIRPYRVNLAGLKLSLEGLAYQKQDKGTAVCASIALWCALQRVAYMSGHRTPTPSAITKAANSPFATSAGLDEFQMATALDSLGYLADFITAENRSQFLAKVVAYLESQLPVILMLSKEKHSDSGKETVAHAVTAIGFQQSQNIVEIPTAAPKCPLRMQSGSLKVIYVHDDNLGPYAHYEFLDALPQGSKDYQPLKLRRGRTDQPSPEWWPIDEWIVEAALVPTNEKMRLPIENLFLNLLEIRYLFNYIFGDCTSSDGLRYKLREPLHYGIRVASGVEYKRDLFGFSFDSQELRCFLSNLTLPRYIGIIQVNSEELLCEMIIDISEVNRVSKERNILAIVAPGVPKNSPAWKNLQELKFPLLTARPNQDSTAESED